jgi:hypothetical protein
LGFPASGDDCVLASGDAPPDAPSTVGEEAGAAVAAGEGCGVAVGSLSGLVDCRTEWDPVTAGSESIKAISINAAAAPMVTFASILAVPLGPKAVLDTLLEKSAPASDFPGWSKTKTISTTQERINSPYKMYVNISS